MAFNLICSKYAVSTDSEPTILTRKVQKVRIVIISLAIKLGIRRISHGGFLCPNWSAGLEVADFASETTLALLVAGLYGTMMLSGLLSPAVPSVISPLTLFAVVLPSSLRCT